MKRIKVIELCQSRGKDHLRFAHFARPVGWAAIIQLLRLNCPEPVDPVVVHRSESNVDGLHIFPSWRVLPFNVVQSEANDNDVDVNFAIASQHEVVNLHVLGATIGHPEHHHVVRDAVISTVSRNREAAGNRRLWFAYEWLSGETLDDLQDLQGSFLPVVDILDENRFCTSLGEVSLRHRVRNNMLGVPEFCPYVKRSKILEDFASKNFSSQAWFLLNRFTPDLTRHDSARAARAESPYSTHGQYDAGHLMSSLAQNENLDTVRIDESSVQTEILPALMGVSNAADVPQYRTEQAYVSETVHTIDDTKDEILFVAPKPCDVPSLMHGLFHTMQRALQDRQHDPERVDCVAATAMLGFGLVFIHPFGDGNGRLHRFMMQQILRRLGYVPDMIFPVCNIMVRRRSDYEECMEHFDREVMSLISYTVQPDGQLTVHNETAHLYRYFDATAMVEYLYSCVRACVEEEIPSMSRDVQATDNWSI
eukprot:GGOE01024344.1.p1 GENE.GGOE01024344.1~~GGOE01024344.1.p1  ORF type:complete len:479 (-),score=67.66 GGOE01024344.1:464-1900(-)